MFGVVEATGVSMEVIELLLLLSFALLLVVLLVPRVVALVIGERITCVDVLLANRRDP